MRTKGICSMMVFCIVAFLMVFSLVRAGPDDFFSEQDSKSIETLTLAKIDKTGDVSKNLKETYFAVEILTNLGVSVPSPAATCKFAKEGLGDNIENVFYSVSITKALNCGEVVSDKIVNTITTALNGNSLLDLVYAVGSVSALKPKKHIVIDPTELLPAVTSITDLLDTEYGTWFSEKNQDEGSAYYAGLALTSLAQLVPYIDVSELSFVLESIPLLLSNGVNDESRLFFRHTDSSISSLKTTAFLIKGLADLSAATKGDIGVQDENVDLIASFIISQKFVLSLEDSHALLVGLGAVNSPVFKRPLVLSLVNTQIRATKEKDRETDFKIRVTDIFGKYTVPVKVFLVRAYHSGKDEVSLLSNQEVFVVDNEKHIFSLDFLAARPDPGAYYLEFRVIPQEKQDQYQTLSSALRRVQVVAAVGLSDGTLAISDQAASSSISSVPFQQAQTVKQQISLKSHQFLSISFKLKNLASSRSVLVHQTFVKITNQETKKSFYFVVPHSGQGYELRLSVAKLARKFNFITGVHEIELLVGDSFISSSFRWVVANVNITYEGKPEPVADSNSLFTTRPPINHNFRAAATLAPEILTNIFTVLVLFPLAFFIISALRVGGLFNNIPTGFTFILAAIFLGGVFSLFGLIVVYWFGLKLFTALQYGGVIGIFTIFFGKEVLRYYALQRHSAPKEKETKPSRKKQQ